MAPLPILPTWPNAARGKRLVGLAARPHRPSPTPRSCMRSRDPDSGRPRQANRAGRRRRSRPARRRRPPRAYPSRSAHAMGACQRTRPSLLHNSMRHYDSEPEREGGTLPGAPCEAGDVPRLNSAHSRRSLFLLSCATSAIRLRGPLSRASPVINGSSMASTLRARPQPPY